MVLPSSGLILMSQIKAEFSKSNPVLMSSLYNAAAGIPASGLIKLSNFYGKTSVPLYLTGQKYPPAAMTANTTTFSALSYGNGTYTANGYTPIAGAGNNFFYAYDTNPATNYSPNATFASGVWTGTSTTFTGAGTYAGPWVQITLPYIIKVASISIVAQAPSTNGPQNVSLLGSNDGTNWTVIASFTSNITYTGLTNAANPTVLNVNASDTYITYILVWTSITSKTTTAYLGRLADWYLTT